MDPILAVIPDPPITVQTSEKPDKTATPQEPNPPVMVANQSPINTPPATEAKAEISAENPKIDLPPAAAPAPAAPVIENPEPKAAPPAAPSTPVEHSDAPAAPKPPASSASKSANPEDHKKATPWVWGAAVMKFASISSFCLVLFLLFVLKSQLDPKGGLFDLFGFKVETTAQIHQKAKKEITTLEKDLTKTKREIKDYQSRLDKGSFSDLGFFIKEIEKNKLSFFHDVESYTEPQSPEIVEQRPIWGVMDSLKDVEDLFNFPRKFGLDIASQKDFGLLGNNRVKISQLQISQESISFGVEVSNGFDKVFSLGVQLVELLNQLPMFSEGEIRNFSRQQNNDLEAKMSFSLQLKLTPGETIDLPALPKTTQDFVKAVDGIILKKFTP